MAHQFEDLEQQQEADALGIWVFLVTEIMFFGGLFASYAIYRWLYFAAFQGGSHILDIRLGATNTVVLLGSSLTVFVAPRRISRMWLPRTPWSCSAAVSRWP